MAAGGQRIADPVPLWVLEQVVIEADVVDAVVDMFQFATDLWGHVVQSAAGHVTDVTLDGPGQDVELRIETRRMGTLDDIRCH